MILLLLLFYDFVDHCLVGGKGVVDYSWRLDVVLKPLNTSELYIAKLNVLRDNLTNMSLYDVRISSLLPIIK